MPVEASFKAKMAYGLFICISQYSAVIIRGIVGIMMYPGNLYKKTQTFLQFFYHGKELFTMILTITLWYM